MPTIKSFTIENYKGIDEATIDLVDRINCPVITLIGLNESGKTTVLEGLSHFVSLNQSVSNFFKEEKAPPSIESLIPAHKNDAFTGEIQIRAVISLDDSDIEKANRIAAQHKYILDLEKLRQPFEISKTYRFEDSKFINITNYWSLPVFVRGIRSKDFKRYVKPSKENQSNDLWLQIVHQIEKDLPQVSYFPTFLVNLPKRIYLKEYEDESAINRFYREIFQEILNNINDNLSLDTHINKRIDDFKKLNNHSNWYSLFQNDSRKKSIDTIFNKVSTSITKEILGSWKKIFQRDIAIKDILVEWGIATDKSDMPYASIVVRDSESLYDISDRSLGFRWFFSFLLFTAYKNTKGRPTIYLFDEPAANLHAKAQLELIKSFSKIATEKNYIIYSTHSHHMINPVWLSGAYIVENTALDYDKDDNFDVTNRPTNIKLTKYKKFVAESSSRASYFQPVIEKLDYISPEILGAAPFVIVEGISDYHAFKLAQLMKKKKLLFNLIPGAGASASSPLISLLLGRGESFIILLDDDAEGIKCAKNYKEGWFLDNNSILTLKDIDASFAGKRIEGLFSKDALHTIKEHFGISTTPNKKQIGLYLAEKCAGNDFKDVFPKVVVDNLMKVLMFLNDKFKKK